jgi:hypothetical protein
MELYISLVAMVISLLSVIISVAIYIIGINRERKQATLDAFNVLQEQVFDKLNQYTFAEIREVGDIWQKAINDKRKEDELAKDEREKIDKVVDEYRTLSGLLARIEHFSLGVNTGIYDVNIAERAATAYLVILYRGKLKPLIEVKQSGKANTEYYAEFRKLVERIEKIEK